MSDCCRPTLRHCPRPKSKPNRTAVSSQLPCFAPYTSPGHQPSMVFWYSFGATETRGGTNRRCWHKAFVAPPRLACCCSCRLSPEVLCRLGACMRTQSPSTACNICALPCSRDSDSFIIVPSCASGMEWPRPGAHLCSYDHLFSAPVCISAYSCPCPRSVL